MEYNLNGDNKLMVGDKLKDGSGNHYVVVELRHANTHSQYASEVFVECFKGKHKGRSFWIDHYLASQYRRP